MSGDGRGQREEQSESSNDNLPARYEIGYGKPPVKHRFQKGISGNPRGRPKGTKKKVDMAFGTQPAEELLKQEAYRPVTVREGDQVIELPAIQAVFRAMGVSAMKGNRFAQRTMAKMIRNIEAEDRQLKMEHFEHFVEYKNKWGAEIDRCKDGGFPVPDPLPHPDDIILDPNRGTVRIDGPLTKEQKELFEEAINRRVQAQDEVNYSSEKYRRARNQNNKDYWLHEWLYEQRIFDTINEGLGKRYQVQLENRSYSEGASRKGEYAKKYGKAG